MTTVREARCEELSLDWIVFEGVTHRDAAQALLESKEYELQLDRAYDVRTRDVGGSVEFRHLVTPRLHWEVVPLRQD
jgi:hypothetical protein